MDRRSFLTVLAGAVAGAASACSVTGSAGPGSGDADEAGAAPSPSPEPGPTPVAAPVVQRYPVPGGAISVLPGDEPRLLIGLDDGVSAQAIRDYCRLAVDADLRLVMFGNGCYSSWQEVKPQLAPLVESGRVQLANHTLDHPKLTQISDAKVAHQLSANAREFKNVYGVEIAPWFRPPYGLHDERVDRIAAAEGYHPPVLWTDSFADWETMSTQKYVGAADRCFQPRSIVLAHLNKKDSAPAYPAFVDMIRSRGLRTVTLTDVYSA